MILDYSQFIEGQRHENFGGSSAGTPEIFYKRHDYCPFCQCEIPNVYFDEDSRSYSFEDGTRYTTSAWACPICGWWNLEHICRNYNDSLSLLTSHIVRYSILRSFEVFDAHIPVKLLEEYINKKDPSLIYKIHPTKMEELVCSVFSDFYNCEVKHCGRSHDGGIDLFLILSDKMLPVQVKRRSKKNSVESVSTVREFLGAIQLKKLTAGSIVTTADHYSKEAKKAAADASELRLVDKIELIDIKSFLSMLSLVQKTSIAHWEKNKLRFGA